MAEFTERVGYGDDWAASEQELAHFVRLGEAEDAARKAKQNKQTTVLLLLKAAQERRGHIQTPRLALGHA